MKSTRLWKTLFVSIALVTCPGAARADVVLDWNAIMQATVSGQAPFPQARFAAITQLAVFEAVNAIRGEYKPFLGTITAPADASVEAAAIAAAHTTLKNYFPASAASLDAARTAALAAIPDGPAKTAGIAAGEAAATAMIAARASDGSAPPAFFLPSSTSAGEWRVTPACPAGGGVFFHWRNVTPFGLLSASQFRLDAPPAVTSARYTRDYLEVKELGGAASAGRPADRADVARFYAATTPVAVWNTVARQLSVAKAKTLSENARIFALLNMAISDGAIATFDTKYHYNFWRPETAIRAGDIDDNDRTEPDPAYAPYITTPCFPGYPSAHATLSNAAVEVLERIFTNRRHALILSNPAVPGVVLNYAKFKQITDDIDDARVYGGIHFRFDQETGAELGRRVGDFVYRQSLRRLEGCGCGGDSEQ